MQELRKDPIVGRWVIIAKNRAERPQELADGQPARSAGPCPFCEGHERETTPEVAAERATGSPANGPGWRVRVVSNKYPALKMSGEPTPAGNALYLSMPGVGVHEVILESPRHLTRTTELSVEELAEVLGVYRQRLVELRRDERLVYPMIFKNVGAAAGASIEHTHSQLIVTPIVPISAAEELAGAADYHRAHGRCVYCAMLAAELATSERVVVRPESEGAGGFAAFCPYAARFPLETWILPARHASHFETLSPADARELARVMRSVLARIERVLDHPAYNYIIHTAPFDTSSLDHYHWHIEIIPRVTKTAGFEWGTGFYINPVPPEEAAAIMRAQHFAG